MASDDPPQVGPAQRGRDEARVLAVIPRAVAAALLLVVVACAPRDDRNPTGPAVFSVAFQSPPDSLDPLRTRTARTAALFEYSLGMALLVLDPETGKPMPWLAAALPEVHDGVARWTLHERARWDDGSPVTAGDVAWTFTECRRLGAELGRMAVAVSGTSAVEPVDLRTFEQHFDGRLAVERFGQGFVVLPEGTSTAARGFDAPPGCGPYAVAEREPGRLALARKRGWWGLGLPRFAGAYGFERVVYRYVVDEIAGLRLLGAGDVHLLGLSARAAAPAGTRVEVFHLPAFSYVGWNADDPLLSDAGVRRALSMTIPRRRIAELHLGGEARLVDDPLDVVSGVGDVLAFDATGAARLLDARGVVDGDGDGARDHGGRPISLELLAPAGDVPWVDAVAALWGETLAQLGIELCVTRLTIAGLLSRLRENDYDAFLLVWTVSETRPSFRGLLHSTEIGGRNFQRTRDADLDSAIEGLERGEDDAAARFEALVHERRPITTLFQHPSRVCWNPRRVEPAIGARGVFFPYCAPVR